MRSTGRRGLLLGFVSGVTVLATASAAFACTTYKGKVTLTANAPGSGVASAVGRDGVHAFCTNDADAGVRQNIKIVGTFTLAVAPALAGSTVCDDGTLNAATQLDDGAYEVLYVPVQGSTPSPVNNCYFDGLPIGPMTVTNGAGGGIYAIPPSAGSSTSRIGWVNICVTRSTDSPLAVNKTSGSPSAPELALNLTI